MLTLGIDPSMTCTGVAVMDGQQVVGMWKIRPMGDDLLTRAYSLFHGVYTCMTESGAGERDDSWYVIEKPHAGNRPGRVQSMAVYNAALAAAYIALRQYAPLGHILAPSSTEWSRTMRQLGMPALTGGRGKAERVEYVKRTYGVTFEKKGGSEDVADAILLAAWGQVRGAP